MIDVDLVNVANCDLVEIYKDYKMNKNELRAYQTKDNIV